MSEQVNSAAQHAAVPTATLHQSLQTASNHDLHDHDHHDHRHDIRGSESRQNDHENISQARHQNHSSHEHSEMVMATLHDQMMTLAYEKNPQSTEEAENIAHMLLERAELPLAFRVRAHIVLACGKTDYLHHAQEAVRFAEMGREIFGPGKTPGFKAAVEDLLWEARETLRRAERDMKELEGLRKRIKAGELKWKKGEKIMYGNINGSSYLNL
ncbi:unnamed protein product [Aureobasidium mustum]|uniref:Uncharacterized protein n=1 Tax=Aureobasidium mustum TaxID=2773714 RepID=A0A9N8K6I7_9PEZI|nr:unnamed protein product [Aureobasidium mustum]